MTEATEPDLSEEQAVTAASEAKLGTLHGVVADVLTLHLKGSEVSPAMVGAAITFLKNNNITASPTENAKLAGLKKQLADRRRNKPSAQAMGEAAQAFADLQGQNGLPMQ